jgi:hypothetical protein
MRSYIEPYSTKPGHPALVTAQSEQNRYNKNAFTHF